MDTKLVHTTSHILVSNDGVIPAHMIITLPLKGKGGIAEKATVLGWTQVGLLVVVH